MNELEREFIRQSTADLHDISTRTSENASAAFPEIFLNETFRTLHTIKGTAQTFGFSNTAILAHLLESLVESAKKGNVSKDFHTVFREGIILLIDSFEQENFRIPPHFAEKIGDFQINIDARELSAGFPEDFPETISAQLSAREKAHLSAAFRKGKSIFILEIGFDTVNFADKFKKFREDLSNKGEIIAALPCPKFSTQQKIGFQIIFASNIDVKHLAAQHSAEIILEIHEKFTNSLQGVLAKIVGHGKNSAKMLGKEIEFVILSDDFEPSPKRLKLIFDLLLHLVRNAVSHAIGEKGRVEIDLKSGKDELILSVADNGKGLNFEQIRKKAIERKLKPENAEFSEQEIFDLIFLPDFSTSETLDEISGRGIGLDAVKNLTENAGGKISVKTEKDKGTVFQIHLPNNS